MVKPLKGKCFCPTLPSVFSDEFTNAEMMGKMFDKINEIVEEINNQLENYIDANFNNIMINAIYDPESETIILSKGVRNE